MEIGAVESKTAVESKAIQRGPGRCRETKGYVDGWAESILGLEPKVMPESKATSQLGAITKGSVQDQEQLWRAVFKIKSHCQAQVQRSRAIVKSSGPDQEPLSSANAKIKSNCQAQCHDQEQLSSAVAKIKSNCQAQLSRSRAIVKRSR